ncbi:endonuclease/exonuclease/phosphatase family protein [Labilibacter marinus]|uniref:endonuclease/exonuclease/phosphatase family protein n=1 Tax=Labilibacter marinus TaxID=1477105 RepID=UPI00094F6B39|nr:endonuclease/exonuclease/phosphatase family protein [Labilibacter marinus]
MKLLRKFICIVAFCLSLVSCDFLEPSDKVPSVPLLYFNFNGNNESSGIEPFKIYGNQTMSYSKGIKDSSLNLTGTSYYRKPIVVETKGHFIPQQQNAFAVIVWVNVAEGDNEVYGIIGNKGVGTEDEKGWVVSTTDEGAWQLEVSDGFEHQVYRATPVRQRINDGKWHQLGFMMDKNEKVARTYFDGRLVGVMSLTGIQGFDADYNLFIGCNPASLDYTMDTFNGKLDEIGVWSQRLSDEQFKQDFVSIKKERMSAPPQASDSIRVMTWNIWNGGRQQGKRVGLDRIAHCIKENKADIIALQEGFGSGEYLADKLDYYFYRRSHNLCLLSRFPLGRNLNMYKPINLGCVEVLLNEDDAVIMCPLWLSFKPNIKGLLMNETVSNDTILKLENSSRGNEMTFILSELNQLNNELKKTSVIVAGDFNSGSHLDWTERNKANKYNKIIPFPASKKIENKGFKDAYREVWTNEVEKSGNTYSPIFKEGYKDRIDFIYYKGNHIKATNAAIVDSTTALFPSDHAAVLVTFLLQ